MMQLRLIVIPLAMTGFLAGCSVFPGTHFSATLPDAASAPAAYSIEAITPALLARQATHQSNLPVGQVSPALVRDLSDYSYKVAPHDVISIVVWGDPSQTALFKPAGASLPPAAAPFAGTLAAAVPTASAPAAGFKVDTDGSLYFPYIGRVVVGGKTPQQIQADFSHDLEPFIRNPQVTVEVIAFNSQKFQLAGAVMKPGLYPITDTPLTVSQAIAAAGGVINQVPNTITNGNTIPRPLGDLSHVVYIHNNKTNVLDLRAFYIDGDAGQDRLIAPGDIIQVPDISQEQVHVVGEVPNPGNYPLNNGVLNLAQLLGDAGNLTLTTANPSRIFVFRGTYQKPEIFWLDARSPDALLLADKFELQSQDVVYVASTALADWNRIIGQILPTVETLYETKVLVNH